MGTDHEAEVTTFWSDVIVARPENLMTGVSFTRGGYHRIGRNVTAGLGGYTVHRAGHWIFDGTGLGYGDVLGAGATVVGYECDGCAFNYRDGLPYPTGEDGTPSTFEILGTCPTQHFTRETSPRPPAPGEPSELEYIASRVFGTRDPEVMERIRTLSQGAADDPSGERIRARLEWLMADPATVTDELVAIRRTIYARPGFSESMRHILCLQDPEIRRRNLITDAELAAVPHGALVVWTSNDPSGPAAAGMDMAAKIPGGRFEHITGAGHWPQWEQRDVFNKLILQFLAE